jgi:putative ABC transport system permease protein
MRGPYLELTLALRRLRRTPGFSVATIVLLAIGLAGNLIVLSAIHALRWKPLPLPDSAQLVTARVRLTDFGFDVGLSAPVLDLLREHPGAAAAVGGHSSAPEVGRALSGHPEAVATATPGLFETLGVPPMLGRTFVDDDVRAGSEPAIVLGAKLWQERYRGAPDAIGRTLEIGGTRYRVIGVMPERFAFPSRATRAWIGHVRDPALEAASAGSVGDLDIVARLRPGASADTYGAALDALLGPNPMFGQLVASTHARFYAQSLRSTWARGHVQGLLLLEVALALVLIATLANVANLVVARTHGRLRELAVSRALGATQPRVLGSVLAECCWLASAGIALGLAAFPLGLELLVRFELLPGGAPFDFGLGPVELGLAAVAALLVTAATALGGCLLARRRAGYAALRVGAAVAGGDRRAARARHALVATQVAVAALLAMALGLLVRSVMVLWHEDPGFDRSHALMVDLRLGGDSQAARHTADPSRAPRFADALVRARAIAGVDAAALANTAPFSGSESSSTYRMAGIDEDLTARSRVVSSGYFEALGVRLLAGRALADGDEAAAVVDELFVRRHFADAAALGRQVEVGDGQGTRALTIVGVARAVRHSELDETIERPTIYRLGPGRAPAPAATLVLRSAREPAALEADLRAALATVPEIELRRVATLAHLMRGTLAERESLIRLLGTFALLALLLVAVGLYAVLAYAIARRRAELSVRLALGASATALRRLVLFDALRMLVQGLAVAAVAALLLAPLIRNRLHGVAVHDPLSVLGALLLTGLVVLAASWLPARRAAQLQPHAALREE